MGSDFYKCTEDGVANNAVGIDYAKAQTEWAAVIGQLCAYKHISGC